MEPEKQLTPRQAIKALLQKQDYSIRELSQIMSLSEKEVLDHLEHIAQAPGPDYHFVIIPAVCRHCGFVFKKRERLRTPSRCPRCRQESISRPRFLLSLRA
ncbi:transcriptional regulator [Desulfobacca acetoxidans]|nr:transcriptional regulator [Desulfobacterales bacterium]